MENNTQVNLRSCNSWRNTLHNAGEGFSVRATDSHGGDVGLFSCTVPTMVERMGPKIELNLVRSNVVDPRFLNVMI